MKAIIKLNKEYLEPRETIEIATVEAKTIFKDDNREQSIVVKSGKKFLVEKQKAKSDNYKMTAKVEINLDKYDYLIFGDKGYAGISKEDIVFTDDNIEEVVKKISA